LTLLNYNFQLLQEIGLTKNQAILYLALLNNGETDAKTLSQTTHLPRTEIYRTLSELEEKGLVDRKIGLPLKFLAVPPSIGLQNSLEKKIIEVESTKQKTVEFIKSFQCKENSKDTSQYSIKLLNGRKRILQKIIEQHNSAKHTIEVISNLTKWLQVIDECFDSFKNALDRGIHYRVIIGLLEDNCSLPNSLNYLLKQPNFELKTVFVPQSINSMVFDCKEVNFNYYALKPLGDGP
jgi:sugar-specific transcriptional regulator TrmB